MLLHMIPPRGPSPSRSDWWKRVSIIWTRRLAEISAQADRSMCIATSPGRQVPKHTDELAPIHFLMECEEPFRYIQLCQAQWMRDAAVEAVGRRRTGARPTNLT